MKSKYKFSKTQRKSKSLSKDSRLKYTAQRSSSLSKSPQPLFKKRGKSAIENLDSFRIINQKKLVNRTMNMDRTSSQSVKKQKLKNNGLEILQQIPKNKFQQLVERQRKSITLTTKKQKSKTPERKNPAKINKSLINTQNQQKTTQCYKHPNTFQKKQKQVSHQNLQYLGQKKLKNPDCFKKAFDDSKVQSKQKTKASSKQNQSTKRNSYSKNEIKTQLTTHEEKLITKFKKLQERYTNICQSSHDESSCVQYITDTDVDVLPSFNQSNKANLLQIQGFYNEDISLNREEKVYLKEFEVLEKDLNRIHKAAILIQKVWRGFLARKKILDQQFEQYYYRAPEIFNDDTFRSCLQLERYSQSIQKGSEFSLKQLTHQTDLNFLVNYESEKKSVPQDQCQSPHFEHEKFIKIQKSKWQEMLNYISQLEKETQTTKLENLFDEMKQFAYQCTIDCSLSRIQTKKLEIKLPQFSQESKVLGEIREAMLSPQKNDYFLKKEENSFASQDNILNNQSSKKGKQSIFEENPFAEFTDNYIKQVKQGKICINSLSQDNEIILYKKDIKEKPKDCNCKIVPLEKWITKQESKKSKKNLYQLQNEKLLHDCSNKTEKEVKMFQQCFSFQEQQINYTISSFSESNKKQNQEQNSTFSYSHLEIDQNDRLKTHTSVSQSPDIIKQKTQQQKYQETIEWDDEQLVNSYTQNQQDQNLLQQSQQESIQVEPEQEENWLNYEEFKFYVLLDLSGLVFDELIEEILCQVSNSDNFE